MCFIKSLKAFPGVKLNLTSLSLSEASRGVAVAASSRCSPFPALPAALRSRLLHVWLARPREGHSHRHPASQVIRQVT